MGNGNVRVLMSPSMLKWFYHCIFLREAGFVCSRFCFKSDKQIETEMASNMNCIHSGGAPTQEAEMGAFSS